MKANLATSLIAYARGGVRKQLLVLCLLTLCVGNMWASAYLKGAWDSWVNHDISGGSCEITLDANTEYEFGIDVDGSFYSYTNQNFTTTSTSFQIYTGNGNCKITTGEAGTYIFKTWYDNGRYMAVYYPQARLTKQKYIYFDARNQTNWNSDNFDARFWFKYYDSGSDNGSVDCNKGNALENWVYYALVPNHDYIGQIQMNRLNPSDHDEVWCTANIAYAKDRTSSAQNCLKEESGKANYCIYWTPQWTTYCPPMSSVTMADNGTTNWGGDGSSATPYLVPTGGDIKVHVTASASALDDANMTPYFLFKKEGSAVGSGAASTEKTITASSTTGTKEAVIVEAYNYYNSTEGTHLSSSAIYYEARTPYTISYNKGTPAASISGSRESEIKLKDVTFTLPGAVFTRTGYTQTGWATSDGGAKTYELSASYTDNAALALYPVWTPKSYTVTLEGMEADSDDPILVNVTYDAVLPSLETKHTKAHYDLLGYWAASDDHGMDKTKQLIEANGKWIPDVAGYTGNDGEGNPTWKRDGIDISLFADWTEHPYTVTTSVSPAGAGTLSCGSSVTAKWVTLSGPITATASIGYSFREWDFSKTGEDHDVYSDSTEGYTSLSNPIRIRAQHDGTLTAKFTEIPTHITITKIGGGEVQINGEDKDSTSVGVTTTRTLRAVAAAGYTFIGWTLPENADFEIEAGNVDNPTITLRGKGAGDAGEIVATFTECWVLSAESEGWGSAEFTIANIEVEDGKAIGYADIALPANRKLQFKMVDKSTSSEYKNGVDQVYYMTYGNSQNWLFTTAKTYNCGITTAGRGVYRFNWNFTDKTMTVVYPESYKVNYGAAVGGSVTSVLDDDGKEIPNGGYVREGGSVTYEATASDGYTFTGWCPNDSYGDTFTDHNPWENSNVTATSNAYAKFHSTNFVIYRTEDDKESDPRAVWDDVESYDGGTISQAIEFRMRVNRLDYWYTLCLPFEVNAVQVWDEVDGAYYDIVPYWRTEGKYYTGHYILRKPVTTTNFAIEGFEGKDRWIDPESSDVLPSKNIPYIIQWHDEYFQGKYISFFGTAGQIIPTAMDKGSYASSDEKVNIYGNNSMTTGTVRDAYLLDPYYGTDGAWMREEIGTYRSVLPFECFILANPATTAKYRVLRREMADDTPTGLDTLSRTEDSVSKVMINNRIYIIRGGKIYTIQGTFVKEVE